MALNPIRIRRILSLTTYLTSHHRLPSLSPLTKPPPSSLLSSPLSPFHSPSSSSSPSPSRFIHSTTSSLSRSFNDVEKIDPETILFEGCDYKHWLIVMDFGKDPQQLPSNEQMVETYLETLAKVFGSVEEAKKRMYACSTTTYTGFQAEMDEETSKKFEGLPGVVFVLPDSYIDPVNKEYGGDKYINGTIIPRPPPVHYGRVTRGRQSDQGPLGQMPYQQGNRAYNLPGSMPGEGRGMPQGGAPQRQHFSPNYGQPGQSGGSNPVSHEINNSEQGRGRGGYQGNGNAYVPSNQGSYNQNRYPHQMDSHPGDHGSYIPRGQVNNHQGHGYKHPHGQMRNSLGDHVGHTPQGQMNYPGDNRNYAPPPPNVGPGGQSGIGSYQQYGPGRYVQKPNMGYDQGASVGHCGSLPFVENQTFLQAPDEQNTMPAENRNYTPAAQTGMNQGR